jgi:hypothetical protein
MRRLGLLVGLVVGLLAACGGGGGGGDDGFAVRYDRSSVTINYATGGTVAPALVQAIARGTPPGPIFVGANTPSGQPDPNIQQVVVELTSERSATVRIHPNPALGVGAYGGTLLLLACPDALCAQHYAGSPYSLSYTITVTQGITLQPSSLLLQRNVGEPASQFVAVTLPPGAPAYTATALGGRVTIDQIGPTGFRVTGQAAIASVQNDVILVQAGDLTAQLPVEYTAREVTLRLDQPSIDLAVASGAAAGASADLAVTQLPVGVTDFSVDASAFPWLGIERLQGGIIRVTASTALPSGTYTGFVTVRACSVGQSVPVTVTVTQPAGGDHGLSANVQSLAFVAAQGMPAQPQVVAVVRPSWTQQLDVAVTYFGNSRDWLQMTTLPNGDLQFSASALGLPNDRHEASVTLTTPGPSATVVIPVTFNVGRGLAMPPPQFVPFSSVTPSRVNGSFLVTAEGPSTLNWTITACNSWLHPTRASGVLGTAFEYEVDVDALRALPAGSPDLTCQLQIDVQNPRLPPGGTPIQPILMPIIGMRVDEPVTRTGGGVVLDARGSRRVPFVSR